MSKPEQNTFSCLVFYYSLYSVAALVNWMDIMSTLHVTFLLEYYFASISVLPCLTSQMLGKSHMARFSLGSLWSEP